MKNSNSSTPLKAAAARANGRKGGTKSPDISRWNAHRHGLNAKKLVIAEGRHLPEYGDYSALHAELVHELRPSSPEEFIAIDIHAACVWRLRRAYRFELSLTERPDAGMSSAGMPNFLRYMTLANRQYAESHLRIEEMRKRKRVSPAAPLVVAGGRDLGKLQHTPSVPAATATSSPTAHASANAGNSSVDTFEQATHSAAAAQVAQPGNPPAVCSTTDAIRQQEGDRPDDS
jgi:hypothetical protein